MIISFTALPTRLPYMKQMINSLLYQHDRTPIYCWIPKEVKRKNIKWDGKLPNFMNNKRVYVEAVEDQGSITKLLPALGLDTDYIITVDDDVYYPRDFVTNFKKGIEKHPNEALCYRGRIFNGDMKYENTTLLKCHQIETSREVDMVTGTWGCLYKREWFTDHLETNTPVDDVVISGYLRKKGIKMRVIKGGECDPLRQNKIDGLFWDYNSRTHRHNNQAIKRHYEGMD